MAKIVKKSARKVETQKKKARRAIPRKAVTRIQGNTIGARTKLKKMAGKARAKDAGKLIGDMPGRKAPVTETLTEPLWHTPAMFLFSLACFLGEWGLRRRSGLA